MTGQPLVTKSTAWETLTLSLHTPNSKPKPKANLKPNHNPSRVSFVITAIFQPQLQIQWVHKSSPAQLQLCGIFLACRGSFSKNLKIRKTKSHRINVKCLAVWFGRGLSVNYPRASDLSAPFVCCLICRMHLRALSAIIAFETNAIRHISDCKCNLQSRQLWRL